MIFGYVWCTVNHENDALQNQIFSYLIRQMSTKKQNEKKKTNGSNYASSKPWFIDKRRFSKTNIHSADNHNFIE